MNVAIIDDHLLRDLLVGRGADRLAGLGFTRIATTGLWLYRLCSAFASPTSAGKLSSPVMSLDTALQNRFREKLVVLPKQVETVALRELAWSMAELQRSHRAAGRNLSAAMLEALALAHRLSGSIVVSKLDVGPNLRSGANADGIPFRTI